MPEDPIAYRPPMIERRLPVDMQTSAAFGEHPDMTLSTAVPDPECFACQSRRVYKMYREAGDAIGIEVTATCHDCGAEWTEGYALVMTIQPTKPGERARVERMLRGTP